jgi:hypothetical protein
VWLCAWATEDGESGSSTVAAPHPTVLVYPGPPQRASMAWYSDEALEAFAIIVWSLAFVLFLVALALPCPLFHRDVKD